MQTGVAGAAIVRDGQDLPVEEGSCERGPRRLPPAGPVHSSHPSSSTLPFRSIMTVLSQRILRCFATARIISDQAFLAF